MRKSFLLVLVAAFLFSNAYTQVNGDYRTAASGSWNNAGTWQRYDGASWVAAVTAPSSTDGVITILNTHTVTANTAITADQVVVDNGGTLTISGGTFTIADGAEVNDVTVNGIINFSTGNIVGTGTLAVNTTMNWSGGTLDAPTTIVGAAAGTITVTNNTGLSDVITIQNGGYLILNAGTMLFNSGTINNSGNIILNNSLAASFTLNTGTCNVNNNVDGHISKNSGAGTFSSTVNINNAGTFVVNSSSFTQSGSTFTNSSLISISSGATFNSNSTSHFNAGASVAGNGTLSFASGTNNINLGLAIPSTLTVNFINGNLQGSGSLTINGAMNWSGGTLDLPTTIANTATVTISNGVGLGDVLTIANGGVLTWNAGNMLFNGGTVNNNGSILLNNSLAASFAANTGVNAVNNNSTGVISKNSGAGVFTFSVNVNNAGIIKGTGTFSFTGSFTNTGTIAPGLSPGILTVNGTAPLSANSTLSIEIMNASGAGTGHDQLQRAGNLTLNGTLAVIETGTVPSGDYIVISLTSGTVNGTFATINLPAGYSVIYNSNNVVLRKGTLVTWYRDFDNDTYGDLNNSTQAPTQPAGYVSDNTDCNDNNINIHPGADEICNGVDDDCDGQIDEGVLNSFYQDMDGDGFGNPSVSQQACAAPAGYVTNNTDCNDNNAAINPTTIWYLDADNDSYYTGSGITQCITPGAGYKFSGLLGGGDCNDSNPNIHPSTDEVCNGIDDDCDGSTDEGVFNTFYQDNDGDGFGNPAVSQQACSAPNGFVNNNTDCNDNNAAINPNTVWFLDADNDNYYTGTGITQCTSPGAGYRFAGLIAGGDCNDNNPTIHPAANEICDGLDNDCDGQADEGALPVNWYQDLDGDGFGNPAVSQLSCTQPAGYVLNNTDCNDNNSAINPNTVWFLDADNDNFYIGSGTTQCTSPGAGYKFSGLLGGGDCNDNNPNIHPTADEVCNGVDDDCDGNTDEGVVSTFYQDNDGDGFGDPAVSQQACSAPNGFVNNNTDCNDNNAAINPNTVWFLDADNDNYYTGTGITQCTSPGAGYRFAGLIAGGDCNDNNPNIHPAAIEICDGLDNDCDGHVDEGALPVNWYQDLDGDGFGNPAVLQLSCTQPGGYVLNNTDCNDNNSAINPNTVWFLDADNDNYYTGSGTTQCPSPGAGYKFSGLIGGGDCNDNNAAINPGATEVCGNSIDDDCDGQADEGCAGNDNDGDGFTVAQGDCNDNDNSVYPGAPELCDGKDNDCDGLIDENFPSSEYRSKQSGNWNDPATWEANICGIWQSNNSIPGANSTVTIQHGHNVTVNTDVTAGQVTIDNGGHLMVAANTFTITEQLTIQAGGRFSFQDNTIINLQNNAHIENFGLVTGSAAAGNTITIVGTGNIANALNIKPGGISEFTGAGKLLLNQSNVNNQGDMKVELPETEVNGTSSKLTTLAGGIIRYPQGGNVRGNGKFELKGNAPGSRSSRELSEATYAEFETGGITSYEIDVLSELGIWKEHPLITGQKIIDFSKDAIFKQNNISNIKLITRGGANELHGNLTLSRDWFNQGNEFFNAATIKMEGVNSSFISTGSLEGEGNNFILKAPSSNNNSIKLGGPVINNGGLFYFDVPADISNATFKGTGLVVFNSLVTTTGHTMIPGTETAGGTLTINAPIGFFGINSNVIVNIFSPTDFGNLNFVNPIILDELDISVNEIGAIPDGTSLQIITAFNGAIGTPLITTQGWSANNAGIQVNLLKGCSTEPPKLYRSVKSGNGTDPATWQEFDDCSQTWKPATDFPTSANSSEVLIWHQVTYTSDISLSKLSISGDGTMIIDPSSKVTITDPLTLQSGFDGERDLNAVLIIKGELSGPGNVISFGGDIILDNGKVSCEKINLKVDGPYSGIPSTLIFNGSENKIHNTSINNNEYGCKIDFKDAVISFSGKGEIINNQKTQGVVTFKVADGETNDNPRFINENSGTVDIISLNTEVSVHNYGTWNTYHEFISGPFGKILNFQNSGIFYSGISTVTGDQSSIHYAIGSNIVFDGSHTFAAAQNIFDNSTVTGTCNEQPCTLILDKVTSIINSTLNANVIVPATGDLNLFGNNSTKYADINGVANFRGNSNSWNIGSVLTINRQLNVHQGSHTINGNDNSSISIPPGGVLNLKPFSVSRMTNLNLNSLGNIFGDEAEVIINPPNIQSFGTVNMGVPERFDLFGLLFLSIDPNFRNTSLSNNGFTFPSNTVLNIDVQDALLPAGEGFDRLHVNTDLDLNNSTINVFDVPIIPVGSSFIVVTSDGQITGNFAIENLPAGWKIKYNNNNVELIKTGICNGVTASITILGNKNKCPVTMQANPGGPNASYQWFKNNVAITGATERRHTATTSGTYTVEVTTNNGCEDMSDPVVITSCPNGELRVYTDSGLSPDQQPGILETKLKIYPNPASDHIIIELLQDEVYHGEATVQLVTLRGDILMTQKLNVLKGKVYTKLKLNSRWKDDLYFAKVIVNNRIFTCRVIKIDP